MTAAVRRSRAAAFVAAVVTGVTAPATTAPLHNLTVGLAHGIIAGALVLAVLTLVALEAK